MLSVLNQRLADNEYLAGEYSIADIANFCWARSAHWSGVDTSNLTYLEHWIAAIEGRPAVQRGLAVPSEDQKARSADEFIAAAQKFVTCVRHAHQSRSNHHAGELWLLPLAHVVVL